MALARLPRLRGLLSRLAEPLDACAVALVERQASSAGCSTSGAGEAPPTSGARSIHASPPAPARRKQLPAGGGGGGKAYAEHTQLQRTLQQYQRHLGAGGDAATAFTAHLWRRKSASGVDYAAAEAAGQNQELLAESQGELIEVIHRSAVGELLEALRVLAVSEQRPDARLLDAVAAALHRNALADAVSPSQIAEILGSLAAIGYRPAAAVLDCVCMQVAERLHACSADDISSLTNSMAAFGRTHFPLMARVADAVVARQAEFTSEALADLLHSFAMLRCDAQRMVDAILQRILFDLRSMAPAALSQLVSGLHLLNHRDAVTDVFLDALAMAALEQLQHFSARQLATLAYNYGTLNHWGRNDQELLDAITIRMLHQHQELTPGELSNLVWALARASSASPRTSALLAAVTGHAADVADALAPAQLARLLHSLAQLSFYHARLFERAEAYVRQRMGEFSAEDLALTACAFARLLHEGPGLMPAALQRLEGRYQELSTQGLCGLVWGAAVLGDLQPQLFSAANYLLDRRSLQDFTSRDFVRLFQAELLLADRVGGGARAGPRLTDWLHAHAERSLKDKLYLDRQGGNTQQELCRCLMQLGIPYALENIVDSVLAVDVVLHLKGRPRVAIKVEQFSKFTSSRPRRLLADAMVTRRLLEARKWKVVCVAEHRWVRLKAFEDKVAYLEERLTEVVAPLAELEAAPRPAMGAA